MEQITGSVAPTNDEEEQIKTRTLEEDELKSAGPKSVGLAVIEQKTVIPSSGPSMATTQWEYWTFCVFCGCVRLDALNALPRLL